jgi:hypothetical protein
LKKKREKGNNIWAFLGMALLFIANVDLVLIPFVFKPLDLSFRVSFWAIVLIANLEIMGWFLFWRWFSWTWLPKTKPIKDTVELTKSILDLLKEHGLLGTVIYKTKETFKWAMDPKRKKSFKKGGHVWMFFLGAEPFFTGGRLLAVIFCGATRWKAGLVSLCIGNTIHVYLSIKSWDLIFYLWQQHKGLLIASTFVFTFLVAVQYIRMRLKRKQV